MENWYEVLTVNLKINLLAVIIGFSGSKLRGFLCTMSRMLQYTILFGKFYYFKSMQT